MNYLLQLLCFFCLTLQIFIQAFRPAGSSTDEQSGRRSGIIIGALTIIFLAAVLHIIDSLIGQAKQTDRNTKTQGMLLKPYLLYYLIWEWGTYVYKFLISA